MRQIDARSGSKNLFPSFGTLQGDAIDSSDPNSHSSGDSLPPDSLRSKRGNPLRVQNLSWTSQALALRTRVPQTGLHALHDEAALKLGHSTQNREDHAAGWRGRVE